MGNKILGKRSKSFYKGFNEKQMEYIRQKYQSIADQKTISKKLFAQAYKLNDIICQRFFKQIDFNEDNIIQEYQFICIVHSLCSMTVQQLGSMIYTICTKNKDQLTQKNLLNFTSICLSYNAYLEKVKITDGQITKLNRNKFQKYDFDKNKVIDRQQFIKICLKDQDYKKWMFNMGFITKKQLQFQDQIYELVDSDIGDEINRHQNQTNSNVDKIKRGIQHRIQDDQFQVVQTVGEQSAPSSKPWKTAINGMQIQNQNMNAPSQTLSIDYVYGYRSYDCRNNLKYDSKNRIIYHQAAIGIVLEPRQGKDDQSYFMDHQDDITCLDVVDDLAATAQIGTKPMIIIWQTNKKQGILKSLMIINQQLQKSVGNLCLSKSKKLLAANCNNQDHKIIIYDLQKLQKLQNNLISTETGVIAFGMSSKNIIFDLKFTIDQKMLAVATLKDIMFVSFLNGVLNSNRGVYGNFSNSPTLCLSALKTNYKGQEKEYILSGMGNGSIYFWEKQQCVKAVCGHTGSVSSIAIRKDQQSFISGDKSGKIIIWDNKFDKQKIITIPKINSISSMIVSLCCSTNKQILIGTKSSQVYTLKIGDDFSRADKIMDGHSQGNLWGLAIHKSQPYFYTGGDDQRLMKWEYKNKKKLEKQIKCQYKIRSIDYNDNRKIIVVGYQNGIVDCYGCDQLDKKPHTFRKIKNPDQQTLNLVKFDSHATLLAVCYQFPSFKIVLLAVEEKAFKPISQIQIGSKIISLDFEKDSKLIQLNTSLFQYMIYDISTINTPKKLKNLKNQVKNVNWATHTVAFSLETQGILTEGVCEDDIICCDRSKKLKNVIVVGDKYSKLKLFTYPTKSNQIFNKYFGHSNAVTSVKFNNTEDYLISIGGEEKSIIVWKYDPAIVDNEFLLSNLMDSDDEQEGQIDKNKLKKKAQFDQFQVVEQEGEQALATKAFLGQIKNPSNFSGAYNPKRDNKQPQQSINIKHVFGIRNKYLKDEVRNQCKFSKSYKQILFPTACMAVKMNIQDRKQQIFLQHKQDIVSFAIDSKRQIMATGQMAQKNPYNPRKKILSIYVWDIQGKKVLNKLDGFHTIAIVLLQFSPNSKLLFSCGNDDKNTFAVYDWRTGSILYSGPVSRGKVNGISWKNDIEFITCGNDHVKFWQNNKSRQGKINGKTEGMYSCVSSKSIYITGGGDGGLYNWVGDSSSPKINAHSGKVHSLVIFNDYLYSGADDGKILGWRLQKNGQIKISELFFDTRNAFLDMIKTVPIKQEEFGVLSIDFNQKGDILIVTKGASVIFSSNNKSIIVHQGHYRGQLWALASRRGQQIFISGGDDGTVRLWDIQARKQINRIYFDQKIRGIDCSNDNQSKILIADARAKLYLYSKNLSERYSQYTGKLYEFNQKEKLDPWVEDIKFSPDSKYIAYGSHGKSMYLEYAKLQGRRIQKHLYFKGGTSALLHLDWSKDSSMISINTQAYQLLFYNLTGNQVSASSTADVQWATWTKKFGFPVQGVFQGVDYTDVNTVCRDPTGKFLAVGYDDQAIRLFKYPCYIPKQLCKTYYGHSSHVTRIRFTPNHLISIGGLDRTIIIWNIEGSQKKKAKMEEQDDESDGLEDLDEDIDLPGKAIIKKKKKQKVQQFYHVEDQGDQFTAIKPWLGTIKQPSYQYPKQTQNSPNVSIQLEHVQGYRCKDCRQNIFFSDKQTLIFHAAAVLIYHNIRVNTQKLLVQHNDDILSIDYHQESGRIITGEIGPKPTVCIFKNGKLQHKFKAPVTKGVLAVGISPNGDRAACVGMDEDHYVTILDLNNKKILASTKGGKKVILKLGWINNSQFVTIGINHYRYWIFDKTLTYKQGKVRGNFVSLAISDNIILTGGQKGTVLAWKNNSKINEVNLQLPPNQSKKAQKNQKVEIILASVVQSLKIQQNFVAAGTKDGYIFIMDINSLKTINCLNMKEIFKTSGVQSENPAIRAIDFIADIMCVGTLGAQIYTVNINNIKENSTGKCVNVLKCHYSPNNSWTNQVWGLYVDADTIFTCSDDATLRCWSIQQRKMLSCASLNVGPQSKPLEMDKKTKDFTDSAKGRAVCLSPDKKQVVVGCKNGTVRVYTYEANNHKLTFKMMFRDSKQQISVIKNCYNTLIIGSHDNCIYVYDYDQGTLKKKYKPLKKHSSYITHIDTSRDSCFLQSTCGAYELLYWDLNVGKQITSGATMLRDQRWSQWTCTLGWPVQGIYPKYADGTFINAVDRSNFSINSTLYKDDSISPYLLASGNDSGKVSIYNFPCTIKNSKSVQGSGHSSHVTNVKWSNDDKYLISTGGQDQCIMYWKVKKNVK